MFRLDRNGFVLFGLDVRWYGVLIAVGVLLAVLLATRREKRLGLPRDVSLDLALFGVPVAIVCARLYFVAFSWGYYGAHPEKIISIHEGGLAIYGGLLGGLLVGWLYARRKKLPFLRLADLAAPSFALGQAIGRWGNFLNQEAYGAAIPNPGMHFFPVAVLIEADGLWHYATFFYESVWCLCIVVILLILERKKFFRKPGDIFWWYAMLYAAERAVVESMRTDSLYLGSLRVSQALSLLVLVGVCAMFALRAKQMGTITRVLTIFFPIVLAILLLFGILEADAFNCLWTCILITAICASAYRQGARRNKTT